MAALYQNIVGMFIAVIVVAMVTAQDPEPEYFLTSPTYQIREGESGGQLTVQVARIGTGPGFVRLRISQTGANPATAEDHATSDILLSFVGAAASQNAMIAIIDDSVYEGDGETFTITLTVIDGTPGTVRTGSDTSIVTVQDNDSLFYIDESNSDVSITEDVGVATFTIRRTSSYLTQPATVYFSTVEVSNAEEGSDYVRLNNRLVSFGQGDADQTVDVQILNDKVMESDVERFDVTLSGPTNGELGTPSSVDVSILNDDGVYSFTQSTYITGESSNSVQVCVQRTTENTIKQREVVLTTTGTATATANVDYTPLTTNTGTLRFGVGDNIECADITILGGNIVEATEFFSVQISEAEGEAGSPNVATVTITDDDASFEFVQSLGSVSEGGGTITVSLRKNGYLQTTGSVRVTSSPVSASSSIDYAAVNELVSFTTSLDGVATGTVSITIINDNIDEFDETFDLNLVDPAGGTIGSVSKMTITIIDDDDVVPTTPRGSGGSGVIADLSPSAIGGIVAGAVVGAIALLALLTCVCCMMRCPCCPGLYDACLGDRGRQTKTQPIFAEPAPVYQLEQQAAYPIVPQAQLGWVNDGLIGIDQYNNLAVRNGFF